MSNYYEIEKGRGLFLYTDRGEIQVRQKEGERIFAPVILAKDYERELHDIAYNGSIYFAYINSSGSLVVRSVLGYAFAYEKKTIKGVRYEKPCLMSFYGRLLLFFSEQSENAEGESKVYGILPFEDGRQFFETNCRAANVTDYDFWSLIWKEWGILILWCGEECLLWKIDKNLEMCLLETAKEHYEEVLNKLQTELEKTKNKLYEMQEELTRKEKAIQYHKNQIVSAKEQYNELMETARKFRDECLRRAKGRP